ncbi:MAG: (Fe-S)-binding protein [Saprospiraceae bacterium]|nr:(Fe-S)-binding protein [Saprospiraceae bacterium]MCB9318752.1 (Fe-S)-binding protein [Lewinellaceae bacterium]
MEVRTVQQLIANGEKPEYLFWVGCAGNFDARAQKVVRAFATIMNQIGVTFAVLGNEESCTGDPARRAGNEFLFQMQALQNIQTLQAYEITRIITTCPHCFNTLKNEYPDFGGVFEVYHHTEMLNQWIREGKLKIEPGGATTRTTYHDSCYLGRVNGIYAVPREVLSALQVELIEMEQSASRGLCCGAGGGQMFKEDEPGQKRINVARAEQVLETGVQTVAANCPFCITMLQDGLKAKDKQDEVMVLDLAELIIQKNKW